MAKMIQIRNVPDEMHKEIKARAARKGKSISSFLLEMARDELLRPDIELLLKRVRGRPIDKSGFDATAFIRAERDSR